MFDIEKWVEERKARWAEICAMGDPAKVRDPQAIMEMTDEEYAEFCKREGSGN